MSWKTLYSKCYIPYIKKTMVAVALDSNGRHHPGVVVENSCYPLMISPIIISIGGCLLNASIPKEVYIPPQQLLSYSEKSIVRTFNVSVKRLEEPHFQLDCRLLPLDISLWEHLNRLIHLTYAPISNFPVACLLETDQGYIGGVNIEIENDITLGLCAERIAIGRAVAMGLLNEIKHIHIYAPKRSFVFPCGACRQVLMESIAQCRVSCWYSQDSRASYPMYQLLPHSFFMGNH